MRSGLRITYVFLIQIVSLFIAARLVGNPIMSAYGYLSSPSVCFGYMVDYRYLIGTTIVAISAAVILELKSRRQSTFWSFVAALVIIDLVFGTHLKHEFCS